MKQRFFAAVLALVLAAALFPQRALAAEPPLAASEAYQGSAFYARLCSLELSGDYRADLVNVALSQLGYHEGDSREDYAGGNHWGSGNCTEYSSAFYGMDGQWCAMFVSWCARQAGIPKYIINNAARAAADGMGGTKQYYFHINTRKPADYTPLPGDLVFFSYDGYNSGHVGIAVAVTEDSIWTVEGNSNNAVRLNRYALTSAYILRYGVYSYDAPWAPIPDVRSTELRFASWDGEAHGLTPEGEDGYLFESLLAVEGRMFQLPSRAFCREDGTLRGYYVRRGDGLWLAEDQSWVTAEQLRDGAVLPYLIWDGAAWCWDGVWAQEETLELHCVWESQQGAALPDESAAELRREDSAYVDLPRQQWYYAAVQSAEQAGLLPYRFSFAAWRSMSRGDFAVMLYRLHDSPVPEEPAGFADLEPDSEIAAAAAWACGVGIFRGVADDAFAPEMTLTREQAATVLWRLLGGMAVPEETAEFADLEDVSAWAAEAVQWAAALGLLQGEPGPEDTLLLAPGRRMSRAEGTALVCRIAEWRNLPADAEKN